MYIFISLPGCVFWKILRFHKIKGKKKGVVQTSGSKLHLMLVHEFTDHVGLSVKFTHHILLVVLIMHHIKTFCHLPNRRNKTILVTPIPTEKAFFFFPPLVKRCFFSQDLSIIAAYSLLHISHNEKFENRVPLSSFTYTDQVFFDSVRRNQSFVTPVNERIDFPSGIFKRSELLT